MKFVEILALVSVLIIGIFIFIGLAVGFLILLEALSKISTALTIGVAMLGLILIITVVIYISEGAHKWNK